MVFEVFKPISAGVAATAPISAERSARSTRSTEIIPSPARVQRQGRIIGVISAKGGCGATTLAINLSAALSDKFGSTLLVDGNLQRPDAGLLLGKTAEYGLLDLVTSAAEPTADAVEACTVKLAGRPHGWSLLTPPMTGEASLKTQLSEIAGCVNAARGTADFWVVDLPNHLDRHLVTFLDICDVIVVVFEETMPGVSAVRRWWNTFSQLGYDTTPVQWVMNRAGSKTTAGKASVDDLLPTHCLRVPNCFSLLDQRLASGEPLVVSNSKHKFSQAMYELAERISTVVREGKNG